MVIGFLLKNFLFFGEKGFLSYPGREDAIIIWGTEYTIIWRADISSFII